MTRLGCFHCEKCCFDRFDDPCNDVKIGGYFENWPDLKVSQPNRAITNANLRLHFHTYVSCQLYLCQLPCLSFLLG